MRLAVVFYLENFTLKRVFAAVIFHFDNPDIRIARDRTLDILVGTGIIGKLAVKWIHPAHIAVEVAALVQKF